MTFKNKLNTIVTKLSDEKVPNFLSSLYFRWEDEKKYEDWNDYKIAIQEKVNFIDNITVTKRPFGFKFRLDEYTVYVCIKKKGNGNAYEIYYK